MSSIEWRKTLVKHSNSRSDPEEAVPLFYPEKKPNCFKFLACEIYW